MTCHRTAILTFLIALASAPAFAQTSRTAVGVGESFTAVITLPKDGEPRGGRLYICPASTPATCTTRVGADAAGVAGADVSVVVPSGLQASGLHRVEAAAFNDGGEGSRTVVSLWVGPPPAPGLRVTVTQSSTRVQEFESTGEVGADGAPALRLIRDETTHTTERREVSKAAAPEVK